MPRASDCAGLSWHRAAAHLTNAERKKGHVKGDFQKELLEKVSAYFDGYRQVIVLGDAEFSNETVMGWLYRLLALDRLHELQLVFRWDFELPPPGFQPVN